MQSRADQGSSRVGNPPETASGTPTGIHTPSTTEHNYFLQITMDIKQSIGTLEASNQSLASGSEKHAEKLDILSGKLLTPNGMVKAFGWVLSAGGAILVVLRQDSSAQAPQLCFRTSYTPVEII
jgi:hypothetical protein